MGKSGLQVSKSVSVEVITLYVGISKCRAGRKKLNVYIRRRPHTPRETKRCFVSLGKTQLELCLQNKPDCTLYLNIRGSKQQNSLCLTKSRLEVKIYKFSAFSGQITPKLSLTHHHIMPLNLYLFTRQLFAFQFETGKYLISGPGVVEWKCFNGFVTWSRVKLSHLFLPTQHLGYSRYASARATLIPDQIIKHPFNWRVYQRLTTATFNFDSKGSGFLLVILGLQMSVVIFFQPLNRLLLAQYVPHCTMCSL